jgi:dienelactone hydrolase
MAQGFGGIREAGLPAFAERFAKAGIAVLTFDYRHFGDSSGEPRQLVDTGRQHEDLQAAVEAARSREGIDPERIALWGWSNGGGHVVWAAGRDPRIAAVVAQTPHASGPATLRRLEPMRAARMTAAGLRDRALSLVGRVHTMPIVGAPGETAALAGNEAATRYPAMHPKGSEMRNETPARIMLTYGAYSPLRDAKKVSCPILVMVADGDEITPPGPAARIAEKAPNAELLRFDGGHFDIYSGKTFEWAVEAQTDFLRRHLAPA